MSDSRVVESGEGEEIKVNFCYLVLVRVGRGCYGCYVN